MTEISYHPELCKLASMILDNGGFIDDILDTWQISQKIFDSWRAKYPKFNRIIEEGLISSKEYLEFELLVDGAYS